MTDPAGGHPQVAPATGTPKPPIRHRKNVYLLTPSQLRALRDAFAKVIRIRRLGDHRGYQYWAGLHGVPGQYCVHGPTPGRISLFLPWHRAYLYFFELALRDQNPDAMLAWWDWTSPRAHQEGIPPAFAQEASNPLFSAPIWIAAQPGQDPPMTERDPGDPSRLPQSADVSTVLGIQQFNRFSARLEQVHNSVHGWVSGMMGQIDWAAYDPIFWAHHAMIDRIWSLWQLSHQPVLPSTYLDQALPPFSMTVRQTLNPAMLGYDYASSTSHVGVR